MLRNSARASLEKASAILYPASRIKFMKWSWRAFFIRLVAVFVAALAVSYGISLGIDFGAASDAGATRLSMGIGGFVTSIAFAVLSGWRGWNFKMLLVIAFV